MMAPCDLTHLQLPYVQAILTSSPSSTTMPSVYLFLHLRARMTEKPRLIIHQPSPTPRPDLHWTSITSSLPSPPPQPDITLTLSIGFKKPTVQTSSTQARSLGTLKRRLRRIVACWASWLIGVSIRRGLISIGGRGCIRRRARSRRRRGRGRMRRIGLRRIGGRLWRLWWMRGRARGRAVRVWRCSSCWEGSECSVVEQI